MNLDRESVRVRPQKRPDPLSLLRERHGCEDATKAKTQEIKDGPGADSRCVNDIGGDSKPDQYGRRWRGLGRGSAHPLGRQAFLRRALFEMACFAYVTGYGTSMTAAGMETTSDIARRERCAAADLTALTATRIEGATGGTRTSLFSPLAEAL